MKKIMSFVKLDFYSLKPYWGLPAAAILITILLRLGGGNLSTLATAGILRIFLLMFIISPFTNTERDRLDTLYTTLPLTRKNIVQGRYAYALCVTVVGCVMDSLLTLLVAAVNSLSISISEISMQCVFAALLLLLTALQYPILFKWSYSKNAILPIIPLLLVVALYMLIFPNPNIGINGIDVSGVNPLLAIAAGLLMLGVSYLISCKIYVEKDV